MKFFGIVSILIVVAVIGFMAMNAYESRDLNTSDEGQELKSDNAFENAEGARGLMQQHEDLIESQL